MTDLTPYFDRLDILKDTALQIEKDFGMSGLQIGFSGQAGAAYAELFSQVLPHIEKLNRENSRKFFQLMYRIDLSETQIQRAMEKARDKSFPEVVTELILQREVLKVVMRRRFSG